jgi:hypothetical protein
VTSENATEYTLGMIMDGHRLRAPSYTPLYSDVTTFFEGAGDLLPDLHGRRPRPVERGVLVPRESDAKDAKTRRWMPWVQYIPQGRRVMKRPATDYSYAWIAQGMADMIAAGGFGAIGAHGQHNGIGSHWEVWMAAAATGNMGALEVASLHGARFIGREKDLGSLEVGKLADFMILNRNPLENIRATTDIQYVVKGGWSDDDTLNELWPPRTKVRADVLVAARCAEGAPCRVERK